MLAETKSVVNIQLTLQEAKLLVELLDQHCQTYSARNSVAKFRQQLLDMIDELLGGQESGR